MAMPNLIVDAVTVIDSEEDDSKRMTGVLKEASKKHR
jgi:hypothetical protein